MKDFKKYYTIRATPEEIYVALTNPLSLKLWTDAEAVMSTEPGSEFSLLDGEIVGKNLEFVENKKILQEWYFGENEVPSIVNIQLHPKKDITSVYLLHTNIPDEAYEDIIDGWDNVYFASLEDFFSDF
jgi:activator of HSP90 ATPase